MKSRKKVHAHKRGKKRPEMRACSGEKITFIEYKPEVVTIKEMKKPKTHEKSIFRFALFRIQTEGDTY